MAAPNDETRKLGEIAGSDERSEPHHRSHTPSISPDFGASRLARFASSAPYSGAGPSA
jgi:hypothetical protein